MLGRSNRLLVTDDFRKVFKHGRKIPITGALLVVSKADQGVVRWGFVVPKKVGSAVVRNRVKRRLREAARILTPNLDGKDIVVRAQENASTVSFQQWISELSRALGSGT